MLLSPSPLLAILLAESLLAPSLPDVVDNQQYEVYDKRSDESEQIDRISQ
jgi:hypothetical protein